MAEAARAYKIPGLQRLCSEFLLKDFNNDTVLSILQHGVYFDDQNLVTKCLDVIAEAASSVLKATEFEYLSNDSLAHILDIKKMNRFEVELFQACIRWAQAEVQRQNRTHDAAREMLEPFIPKFRFPTMTLEDFSEEVISTKLLTIDEVARTYQQIITQTPVQDRPLIFENRGKPVQYLADVILQGNRSTISGNFDGIDNIDSFVCFVNANVTLFKIHSLVLDSPSSSEIRVVQNGNTTPVSITRQRSHKDSTLHAYVLSPTLKLEQGYFTVRLRDHNPSHAWHWAIASYDVFNLSPMWQKKHHGSTEWWCRSDRTPFYGFQYKITPCSGNWRTFNKASPWSTIWLTRCCKQGGAKLMVHLGSFQLESYDRKWTFNLQGILLDNKWDSQQDYIEL